VQHPDYYDISTISYEQVKNQQSKIVLAGVSVVGVKFFNTYNKDKPETILSYGFDPYRGGGHPSLINITDTIEHFFYIPALHNTNVRYTLFLNMEKYDNGINYLQGVLFPFTTAKTSDTANIIVNY
jgi:hypothetical protein